MTSAIVSKTETSARLTMLVTTVSGISAYWSESTPMAKRRASCAASNTPCPVAPAAWYSTSAPAAISAMATALPFAGSLNASGEVPTYAEWTVHSGQAAFTPAS